MSISAVIISALVLGLAGWLSGYGGRRLASRLRAAPVRAPTCELPIALLWATSGIWVLTGAAPAWWLPVPLCLAWFGVLLAVIDLAERRLPDALTGVGFVLVLLCICFASVAGPGGVLAARGALGVVLFGGAHLAVHLLNPASMGAGDVKLSASLGGVLGAVGLPALALAAVLGAVLTVALALGARLLAYRTWRGGVPHGPGLLLATWLVAAFPGSGLLDSG
jgi:leader peptidase (prepilin peptidase)/N-methyltransferase